jgi:hypothetical protein
VNCRDALELLGETLADDSGSKVGWRLKLHLWCCRNCRRYFSSYQTTLRLELAAFDAPLEEPPTVPEDLVTEILAEMGKGHSSDAK